MKSPAALKIYAVKYEGDFISKVCAIRCEGKVDPHYVELSRPEMLKAAEVGETLEVVSDASPKSRIWGNVSLVSVNGSTYMTVHKAAASFDDLGDCPQIAA